MAETEFILKLKREQFVSATKRAEKEWRSSVGKMKREVDGLGTKFEGESRKVERASERTATKIAAVTKQVGLLAIATGIAINGKKAVTEFAAFEKGLIGVGKTANIEGKELAAFGDQIQALSREIPVSTSELLELSQAAGQLGVKGTKNLLNFSRVLSELASASDVRGEEGALSIVRILGITNEDISQVDQFTNVLVGLGNNLAATESEILAVATRVAQSTAAFNLSSTEILGISGGLKALGVEAEIAGSSTQKAFIKMQEAITEGGASLATLEQITGRTREQLTQLFETDQAELFNVFIEGLNRVKESGGDVIGTLKELGIQEIRTVSVLSALAKGHTTFAKAVEQSKEELEKNNARSEEARKAFAALESKIEDAGNKLTFAVQEIGEFISPAVLDGLGLFGELMDKIGSSVEYVNEQLDDSDSVWSLFSAGIKEAGRVASVGTRELSRWHTELLKFALTPVSSTRRLLADDVAEATDRAIKKSGELVSIGTIVDLEKMAKQNEITIKLGIQAEETAKKVEASAKKMATATELSARKSIRAIENQIAALQNAADQAKQLQEDINQSIADINAGPAPTEAFQASDAIVKVRRAVTDGDQEKAVKLGREALEIINQLRSDGVIDDSLAKAQLDQLAKLTKPLEESLQDKADRNILQLEKEAEKFKDLTFGFDEATVKAEADKIVEILNGRLKNLIPSLASLAGGKSFNPANFDTSDNIIVPLPVNNKVPAQPTLNETPGVTKKEFLQVSVSADQSLQAIAGELDRIFSIDGQKLVKEALENVFGDIAAVN